jgi:hypothetical protein
MSERRERTLLVGLAAVVGVLVVALVALTVSGSGKGRAGAAVVPPSAASSTPPPAPSSAPPPAPSSAPPPAPSSAPPPAPSSPPPTTTPASAPSTTTTSAAPITVHEPVTAAGAILTPPAAPDVRTEDAPNDCASLVDSGWESLDCRVVEPGPGGLTYLIEVLPAPAYIATRVYIFRETPTGAEQVLLTAEDDNGSRYVASEVEADVAQTGEAQPVLVMGFLEGSIGERLGVDVVRASGEIAAHLDLANGVVMVDPNGLETWSGPVGASGAYTHDTLQDVGGAWWVVQQQVVASDVVPHSDNVLA